MNGWEVNLKIKEQLQAIRNLDFEIDSLLRTMEIERARAERRTTVFSLEGKGGMNIDGRENAYIKLTEMSKQVYEKVDELIDRKREALKWIQQLPDAAQRNVLIGRYINSATWEEVSEQVGYSVSHLYKIHGEALYALEKLWKIKDDSK